MKHIGIWIDKEKARVMTIENGKEIFDTIFSEVEFFNPKGGSRSKTRWGPQDVVQDSKYLEREKHQLRSYFKNIASFISSADAIVIYGPADTNEKFMTMLKEQYKQIAAKVQMVSKMGYVTPNQLHAHIRNYFRKSTTLNQ